MRNCSNVEGSAEKSACQPPMRPDLHQGRNYRRCERRAGLGENSELSEGVWRCCQILNSTPHFHVETMLRTKLHVSYMQTQVAAAWLQKQRKGLTDDWLHVICDTWEDVARDEESDSEAQKHIFLHDVSQIVTD